MRKSLAFLLATLGLAGCQTAQVDFFRNPKGSGALTIEAGQTETAITSTMPRTYSESYEKAKTSASGIPTEIGNTFKNVGQIANPREYLRGLKDTTSTTQGVAYTIAYIPYNAVEALRSVGKAVRNTFDVPLQGANMVGILPLTGNTEERQNTFGKRNLPTRKELKMADGQTMVFYFRDNAEIRRFSDKEVALFDAITDPVKAPLKAVAYVALKTTIPQGVNGIWDGAMLKTGNRTNPQSFARDRTLSTKSGKTSLTRTVVAVSPLDELYGKIYGFQIETLPDGSTRQVPVTISETVDLSMGYLVENPENLELFLELGRNTPGIPRINNGKVKLNPPSSYTLGFMATARDLILMKGLFREKGHNNHNPNKPEENNEGVTGGTNDGMGGGVPGVTGNSGETGGGLGGRK